MSCKDSKYYYHGKVMNNIWKQIYRVFDIQNTNRRIKDMQLSYDNKNANHYNIEFVYENGVHFSGTVYRGYFDYHCWINNGWNENGNLDFTEYNYTKIKLPRV